MRPPLGNTAGSIAKPIPTVRVGESSGRVLGLLAENGVAVLVDTASIPMGILTWCDSPAQVGKIVNGLVERKQDRAEEVFKEMERFGPDVVDTIREDAPLPTVAERLIQRGRKTGITVVDSHGSFRGYAFASDVTDELGRVARQGEQDLNRDIREIGLRYPDVGRRIEERLREI